MSCCTSEKFVEAPTRGWSPSQYTTMKIEDGYPKEMRIPLTNLTSFEWFARPRRSLGETVGARPNHYVKRCGRVAEIFGFQPASLFFGLERR